jgi:hypothetical protein
MVYSWDIIARLLVEPEWDTLKHYLLLRLAVCDVELEGETVNRDDDLLGFVIWQGMRSVLVMEKNTTSRSTSSCRSTPHILSLYLTQFELRTF